MSRTVWLVLLGAVLGSAAAAIAFDPRAAGGAADRTRAERGRVASSEPLAAPAPFATALAANERAAATSDPFELETSIEAAAREPRSARRDAELEALVARLAETDTAEAVRLAILYELDDHILVGAYRSWAAAAGAAALRELSALRSNLTQRNVALALLEVFGYDEQGIAAIAAALPPIEARSFRFDAITRIAERGDIPGALALAGALVEQAGQTIVQQRIAVAAAAIDARAGLEHASSLSIAIQRRRYLDRLLDEWAKVDPDAMLAYLETADLSGMAVTEASFRALAASGPERLLALAERFAPAQRVGIQRAAVEVLAALDPVTAYHRVSALPRTNDRDNLIASIARDYAEESPDAALAWAASLEPRSPVALNAVITTVAADDSIRAAEVAIAEIIDPVAANRGELPSMPSVFAAAIRDRSGAAARLADLLSAHPDVRVRAQLGDLVTVWPQADAAAAIDWFARNPDALKPTTVVTFARQAAAADPALTRESLQRLPAARRAAWMEGAATAMAARDLEGTLAWIATMRGEQGHDRALEMALRAGASSQPFVVASYLERMPALEPQLTATVARSWAERDAPAAADWLTGRANVDEATFAAAAAGVASVWVGTDAPAAERWVRGLPSTARDEGFAVLVRAAASRDPALARRLVTEITNPILRARTESQMEAAARSPEATRPPPVGVR